MPAKSETALSAPLVMVSGLAFLTTGAGFLAGVFPEEKVFLGLVATGAAVATGTAGATTGGVRAATEATTLDLCFLEAGTLTNLRLASSF